MISSWCHTLNNRRNNDLFGVAAVMAKTSKALSPNSGITRSCRYSVSWAAISTGISKMQSPDAFLPPAAACSARNRSLIGANIGGRLPFDFRCSIPLPASCKTDQTCRPSAHNDAALHITCSSTKQVTTSAVCESRLRVVSSAKVGKPLFAVTRYQPEGKDAPVRSDSGICS